MDNNISKNTDHTDEIRFVREAQAGNKESFCRLYGLYKDKLYRYALYRLCDHTAAEDAVSECVLAAWKDIRRLKSESAFGSWIFRILKNTCAGMIRKEIEARETAEKASAEISGCSLSSSAANTQTAIELSEALAKLRDDEREIVMLSVIAGLTSKEISDLTGLKPGAVRSKLSRSLASMREFLGSD